MSLIEQINDECVDFNIHGYEDRTLPYSILERVKDDNKWIRHLDVREVVERTLKIVEKRCWMDEELGLQVDREKAFIQFAAPDGTMRRHRVRTLFYFIITGEYGYGTHTLRAPEGNPLAIQPDKLTLVPTEKMSIKGASKRKSFKYSVREITGGWE